MLLLVCSPMFCFLGACVVRVSLFQIPNVLVQPSVVSVSCVLSKVFLVWYLSIKADVAMQLLMEERSKDVNCLKFLFCIFTVGGDIFGIGLPKYRMDSVWFNIF